MRRLLGLAIAIYFAAVSLAFASEPAGHYEVKGTNPGSPAVYTGEVTVTKTGDTYKVIWIIGRTRYVGTGIGTGDFITVSYKAGRNTGVALYSHDGDNWKGVWTYANGTTIGTESWTRQ